MADNETPAVEQGTGTPIDQIPTEFKAYDHWRRTGELPAKPEETSPSATATESAPATGEPAQVKTAPDSEPEDSQETEEVSPSRPSSRQRRIDRLTRDNAELQRRLEMLEQKTATPPAVPAPVLPVADSRPDLKDFKTLEDYTEALTEWKIDQREKQRRADEE